MIRRAVAVMTAVLTLGFLAGAPGWAPALAKDENSLVGRWDVEPGQGEDDVWVEFRADGTGTVGDADDPTIPIVWVIDMDARPLRLELQLEGSTRRSILEFLDDDRVRITEPASDYPANFDEASYLVFARDSATVGTVDATDGADGPPDTGATETLALTEEILVGSWAPEDEGCFGERIVMFSNGIVVALEADGTLREGVGTWALVGQTLLFDIINPVPTLENHTDRQDDPEQESFTLVDWTADQFTVSDGPGSAIPVIRCR